MQGKTLFDNIIVAILAMPVYASVCVVRWSFALLPMTMVLIAILVLLHGYLPIMYGVGALAPFVFAMDWFERREISIDYVEDLALGEFLVLCFLGSVYTLLFGNVVW